MFPYKMSSISAEWYDLICFDKLIAYLVTFSEYRRIINVKFSIHILESAPLILFIKYIRWERKSRS